jgi:gamma-glutamylputrescine oxidase
MIQPSIWEKQSFFALQDIIIIGSGFAGLWCAHELITQKPGLRITILERGIIPTGASSRNAGFNCFGSPTELLADEANMGSQSLWQLAEWRFKGLAKIHQTFSIADMDYDPCGGYECFTEENDAWQEVESKLDMLNRNMKPITGSEQTFVVADNELPELGLHGFSHLVKNHFEGALHPAKLLQTLHRKLVSLGVQVFTGAEVERYEMQNNIIQVIMKDVAPLSCRQLLLCTNAFAKEMLKTEDIVPARGQVLMTSAIPHLSLKGTFHFDRGFYYFRNLGNHVMVGGARNKSIETENTTSFVTTGLIQKELELFLKTHILPGTEYEITDRWAGIMGMGKEKTPLVKELEPGVFCAVRMGGMGVALAPLMAEWVAEMMLKNV